MTRGSAWLEESFRTGIATAFSSGFLRLGVWLQTKMNLKPCLFPRGKFEMRTYAACTCTRKVFAVRCRATPLP